MYQQTATFQTYGDHKYLDHQINADGLEPNVRLVGERVPSYGVINFGLMGGRTKKQVKPIDLGIEQDILLRSLWAFTTNATNEEVTLRLYLNSTEVLVQKLSNEEMPYIFPPGAIINPNLTLEVEPRYHTTQLLIYWQPVHVLNYQVV